MDILIDNAPGPFSEKQRDSWRQILDEAREAAVLISKEDLKKWAKSNVELMYEASTKRVKALWSMLEAAIKGTWEEFLTAWKALCEKSFKEYLCLFRKICG